jgi:hypothetical protein
MKWSTSISLGCSAINDVLIAGTLAYILHKHRTVSPMWLINLTMKLTWLTILVLRTNQMITKLIIFCSQTGLITTQVPWYWQWICAHCFLCSVAAFIAIGIVGASSRTVTMVLTKIQWAVCRFDIYHLYMCFPIGGCESLVLINSSTRNDLTILAWQYTLHVFSPSESFSAVIEETYW